MPPSEIPSKCLILEACGQGLSSRLRSRCIYPTAQGVLAAWVNVDRGSLRTRSRGQCQRNGEKQRNDERNNLLVLVDRLHTFRQTFSGPGSLVDELDKEADPLLSA